MKEKAGYYISNLLTAIVNLRALSATLYAVYKPGASNKLNIKNRHGLQTSSFSGVMSFYEVLDELTTYIR